jgi:hypothetical protein
VFDLYGRYGARSGLQGGEARRQLRLSAKCDELHPPHRFVPFSNIPLFCSDDAFRLCRSHWSCWKGRSCCDFLHQGGRRTPQDVRFFSPSVLLSLLTLFSLRFALSPSSFLRSILLLRRSPPLTSPISCTVPSLFPASQHRQRHASLRMRRPRLDAHPPRPHTRRQKSAQDETHRSQRHLPNERFFSG